jgi:hypothetical protein
MSTAETTELTDVLNRVKTWSPESRIVLARRILETLDGSRCPPRGLPIRSVRELIGLGAGELPPPDDETVLRWMAEHRTEKYGS